MSINRPPRHRARPRRRLPAIAAAVVLASATACATTAAANPGPARPARCVVVTLGWRTVTGAEADAPLTLCGAGVPRRPIACTGPRAPQPGAAYKCVTLPRPPGAG